MYPTTNENIIEFISKLAKNFNKVMGRLHRISMNNVSSNVKDNLNNRIRKVVALSVKEKMVKNI